MTAASAAVSYEKTAELPLIPVPNNPLVTFIPIPISLYSTCGGCFQPIHTMGVTTVYSHSVTKQMCHEYCQLTYVLRLQKQAEQLIDSSTALDEKRMKELKEQAHSLAGVYLSYPLSQCKFTFLPFSRDSYYVTSTDPTPAAQGTVFSALKHHVWKPSTRSMSTGYVAFRVQWDAKAIAEPDMIDALQTGCQAFNIQTDQHIIKSAVVIRAKRMNRWYVYTMVRMKDHAVRPNTYWSLQLEVTARLLEQCLWKNGIRDSLLLTTVEKGVTVELVACRCKVQMDDESPRVLVDCQMASKIDKCLFFVHGDDVYEIQNPEKQSIYPFIAVDHVPKGAIKCIPRLPLESSAAVALDSE